MNPEGLLTVNEAAQLLNVSLSLVYKMCKQGHIRCVRIGRKRVLIPVEEVSRLLGKQPLGDST